MELATQHTDTNFGRKLVRFDPGFLKEDEKRKAERKVRQGSRSYQVHPPTWGGASFGRRCRCCQRNCVVAAVAGPMEACGVLTGCQQRVNTSVGASECRHHETRCSCAKRRHHVSEVVASSLVAVRPCPCCCYNVVVVAAVSVPSETMAVAAARRIFEKDASCASTTVSTCTGRKQNSSLALYTSKSHTPLFQPWFLPLRRDNYSD